MHIVFQKITNIKIEFESISLNVLKSKYKLKFSIKQSNKTNIYITMFSSHVSDRLRGR